MEADLDDLILKLAALKTTAQNVRAETPDADTAAIFVQCANIILMVDNWTAMTNAALEAAFP